MVISVDISFASILLLGSKKETTYADTLKKNNIDSEDSASFRGGLAAKKK